jgi:hypothetical protein
MLLIKAEGFRLERHQRQRTRHFQEGEVRNLRILRNIKTPTLFHAERLGIAHDEEQNYGCLPEQDVSLLTLTLPAGVTAFAGVQALWWLAAALTLVVRGRTVNNLKDVATLQAI